MTPLALLAHTGHWAVSLIYVAPVGVVVGFLAVSSWRERRRDARTRVESGPSSPP